MNLTDLASIASIAALIVSIGSLAFSAKHYVKVRHKEQHQEAFRVYHDLIKNISRGADEHGPIKLVSQIAYVYELRNFPEYSALTENLFSRLRKQWAKNSPTSEANEPLFEAMDETLAFLQKCR